MSEQQEVKSTTPSPAPITASRITKEVAIARSAKATQSTNKPKSDNTQAVSNPATQHGSNDKSEKSTKHKRDPFPWFPETGYGRLSIFLHFVIAIALIILSVIGLPKKGYSTTYMVFSVIGTFVWMIIWYYILSSLWACGKRGKELIVGLIIVSEIIMFIGAAMYFFQSSPTTNTPQTTPSQTTPPTLS